MALIWQQFMSAEWLRKKQATLQPYGGSMPTTGRDDPYLTLLQGGAGQYRNVLFVNLWDHMSPAEKSQSSTILKSSKEIVTFAIDVTFDVTYQSGAAAMPNLFVMLMEAKRSPQVLNPCAGFRFGGPASAYARNGLFCGAKGSVLVNQQGLDATTVGHLKPEAPAATPSVFPLVYQMLLRPTRNWGTCYAPFESGHLATVSYPTQITFQSGQAALGLYSDEGTSPDEYRLSHLSVSMHKED
jgi:hypothetical protein